MDCASTFVDAPPRGLLNSSVNLAAPGTSTNHEVALWKGCISHHERPRHPENNLGADLRADGKCADGHSHQDVEREFCCEWLHEISLRYECAREDISPSARCPQQKSAHRRRSMMIADPCDLAACGAMLVAWQRNAKCNRSGLARDCARIASMHGALNPIAAPYSICVSWQP